MGKRLKDKSGVFAPKFDYDSDEWYTAIRSLAMSGFTDGEIAVSIGEKIQEYRTASGGQPLTKEALDGLTGDAFKEMKNGRYPAWSKKQNEERSQKIKDTLENARMRVNGIVRGAYLRAALGGKKLKNKGTTYRRLKIDGRYTDDEEIQRTETESEMPPNIQALSTWLYHHDAEWRKVQRGRDAEGDGIPQDIVQGIDVAAWIDKEVTEKEIAQAKTVTKEEDL